MPRVFKIPGKQTRLIFFSRNVTKSNKFFSFSKLKFPSCFQPFTPDIIIRFPECRINKQVEAVRTWKKNGGISADSLEFCRQFAGYHVY